MEFSQHELTRSCVVRFPAAAIAAALIWFAVAPRAEAGIYVTVDKSAQRLTVEVNGALRYQWPVSTARWGYNTPNGSYRPQRLERQWYSRKYDWSPMPYSIFFAGGYAIHGSYEVSRLGRPASHGCIRLHPHNAAILFDLVKRNIRDTHIIVTGAGAESYVSRRKSRPVAEIAEDDWRPRQRYRERVTGFEEIFDDHGARTYQRARRAYR
jgi:hypothetical protein